MQEKRYVYIIQCSDNAYFIDVTGDLINEFRKYNQQQYEFTKFRLPVEMKYMKYSRLYRRHCKDKYN
jgi:predicted GIY-YIG superfamily endonuclease